MKISEFLEIYENISELRKIECADCKNQCMINK